MSHYSIDLLNLLLRRASPPELLLPLFWSASQQSAPTHLGQLIVIVVSKFTLMPRRRGIGLLLLVLLLPRFVSQEHGAHICQVLQNGSVLVCDLQQP